MRNLLAFIKHLVATQYKTILMILLAGFGVGGLYVMAHQAEPDPRFEACRLAVEYADHLSRHEVHNDPHQVEVWTPLYMAERDKCFEPRWMSE